MEKLFIYNTLTRKKEEFKAINPPFVGMYVCGPTVYSDVHLGNCRTFMSFDIIYRYLLHLGYKVRYVRNITDAGHLEGDNDEGDDKFEGKAKQERKLYEDKLKEINALTEKIKNLDLEQKQLTNLLGM